MILFPYKDDNPTRSFPLVNWFLIGANLWVFFAWQFPLDPNEQQVFFSSFGFIPSMFFGQLSTFSVETIVWEWGTIITSMFSHGGIFHLLGNVLFLYLYGDNVEEAMGKLWYLLFYLSCGLLAALAQALTSPDSGVPMVGASGAISGVIASYLLRLGMVAHPTSPRISGIDEGCRRSCGSRSFRGVRIRVRADSPP